MYALPPLRIEGATFLSTGEAPADEVKRRGRYMSDECKGFVRSHVADVKAVSDI